MIGGSSNNFHQPSNNYNHPSGNYSSPNTFNYRNPVSSAFDDDFENEPPLLEELDIHFDHILAKTQAVMIVNKVIFIFLCT